MVNSFRTQNGRGMKKCIIILTMAVMALSCERQLRQPHPVEITYTPEISVSFAGDTPAEPMLQISAYKLSGEKFLYTSQDGATFSLEGEEVPSHIAYAVYPVDGRDSLYRGVFCRDLKSEQVAVLGGYDQSAMWYAGQVKDNHAVIQQVCAFLKFRIVQPDVASVNIVSKDASLSGMYTFAMNSTITAYSSDESLNSVTLSGDFELDGTYKAVCIPGSFKKFGVTMKNADGYTLWNSDVVSEYEVSCAQTVDLGDFGNPDVAAVHLKLSSDEFAGYTVKAVNLYHGSGLDNVLGTTTSETIEAGETLVLKVYGVAAADYTGKKLWAVSVLEKDGVTYSVPMQIDGMNIPASETVVIDLGQLRSDVPLESDDNYILYKMGRDIMIGDLRVNVADYPECSLKKPSEITLDLLKAGGLIFIDDEAGTGVVDLSTTSSYESCPYNNNLVLIGRYKKNGTQTELKIKQWRTWYDLAMANVKLTCTYSTPQLQLFAKTSSDTRQTKLFLQDCNIDMTHAKFLIEDMENAGSVPYSDIRIDNCVVKMSDSVKETSLYRYRNVTALQENISITNNVVYTPSLKDFESHLFRIYGDYAASGMTVTIADNTVINIHGNTGVIRRGSSLAGMTVSGNLVVTDNTVNEVMTTANNRNVFFLKNIGTMSAGNNFLTTINYTGDTGTINKSKMQSLTKTTTDKDEQTVNPFTSMNYTTGYFPINSTVVTNGAGASYDTKYYITR